MILGQRSAHVQDELNECSGIKYIQMFPLTQRMDMREPVNVYLILPFHYRK